MAFYGIPTGRILGRCQKVFQKEVDISIADVPIENVKITTVNVSDGKDAFRGAYLI